MPEAQDAAEEVVNGEIRVMSPLKSLQGLMSDNLCFLLCSSIDPKRIRAGAAGFGLTIRKTLLTSGVPDLAMFFIDSEVKQDGYLHSAPQLAVEVLSTATTRQEKLDDYGSISVPAVRVISPEGRTEVLQQEDSRLLRSQILAPGDILKPKLLPHVQVHIEQIWPN